MSGRDMTTRLADGSLFEFWEQERVCDRILYVDNRNPLASDDNDGSRR